MPRCKERWLICFNTQPPEGGCESNAKPLGKIDVSTHSRPKAAARSLSPHVHAALFQHTAARRRLADALSSTHQWGGFNTQPPEGGCCGGKLCLCFFFVSTHSRPKAAVQMPVAGILGRRVSTHSRPKAAALTNGRLLNGRWFQHTAARRRLHGIAVNQMRGHRFNTQPPEGGCSTNARIGEHAIVSTHSRPKAADHQA